MKLRTRLMISFCVLIVLPIVLVIVVLAGLYQIQSRMVYQNYGVKIEGSFDIFSNSLQRMSSYTKTDFEALQKLAQKNPEKLHDSEYLEEENEVLQKKMSFLILCENGKVVYNGYQGDGQVSDSDWEDVLPAYGESERTDAAGYYLDGSSEALIKQVDFLEEDGTKGSIYIVTSTESMMPEIRQQLITIIVALLFVLAVTAGMMTMWISQGTITPIRKLQVATKNIKEGNLDFTIDYEGKDEMAELCRNFEEMRQRLKESTEEKMAAEKENRALISNIAHDLKTPITAVKGYSEGIMDGVADTPEKMERYVRTIYNKANEMDRLINELTLYSKIDTNRIPYNFNKINVAAYFDDCIEEIGLDLETREIGLSYANYTDGRTMIIADPEQLMRVINNIINNAVKYMDKAHGQIDVRIRDVGDFIQVEIQDNGKGIDMQDLPYIFDRFYRTDSSRNSATGGSGIGLSIVKKVIEDHGGKIWANSKPGEGTTMFFVLRKYQDNSLYV